jgi:hypothetical protein
MWTGWANDYANEGRCPQDGCRPKRLLRSKGYAFEAIDVMLFGTR